MSAAERNMMNTTGLPDDTLDRIAFALIARMKVLTVVEKPMNRQEVAAYLGYSEKHVGKLVNAGVIKAHRFTDDGDPRYLASEILERLKKN
jgi:hypothetical protein